MHLFMFWLFLRSFTLFINVTHHPSSLYTPSSPLANNPPPCLVYFISGTESKAEMLKRVLHDVYHTHNVYAVYLDKGDLCEFVESHPVFSKIGNVKMIGRSNLVPENGTTKIVNVFHAAAVLLKDGGQWDWFINLDASSYRPLLTPDDLSYALSQMRRHLNFIDHTSHLRWNQNSGRSRNVIIHLPEERVELTAFNLFSGSPWMGLTRSFIEYCIFGQDHLPRIVLMYHANSISSAESYFLTIIFNSPKFRNITIRTDLHNYKVRKGPVTSYSLPLLTMDDRISMLKNKSNTLVACEFFDWLVHARNVSSRTCRQRTNG